MILPPFGATLLSTAGAVVSSQTWPARLSAAAGFFVLTGQRFVIEREPRILIHVSPGLTPAEPVMPLYTIDTDDGDLFVAGSLETGIDCPLKARMEAHRVLGSMTRYALPDGEHRVLQAIVRDDIGQEVYVATITFTGEWKIPLGA